MIKEFTYLLPDELYVEGISGDVIGTFVYEGPETFDVAIDDFGNVVDIDVQVDPELGPNFRKTIDANEQIEVAYMFAHYFDEHYERELEFEDEILDNGDVYKKLLNPDLKDAYEIKFNIKDNDWELIQIVKQQDNPSSLEAKRRKEYIEKYSKKYSFGQETDSVIANYISELESFIENNPPLKTWKYANFNLNSVPKLPAVIAIEIAKLPSEGV